MRVGLHIGVGLRDMMVVVEMVVKVVVVVVVGAGDNVAGGGGGEAQRNNYCHTHAHEKKPLALKVFLASIGDPVSGKSELSG